MAAWGNKQKSTVFGGGIRYVNVWGSATIFQFVPKIDLSEITKSHMFDTSIKVTNHKCPTVK